MSLPKQCLYKNKIESSYAKNYMSSIAPSNGTEYNLGETIIINIPTGYNTVASGKDSVLKYTLNSRSGAANAPAVAYLNKCGAYAVIARMRIFHGSVLLSDIDNYACLMEMLVSSQLSTDIVSGKMQILAGTGYNNGYNFIAEQGEPNKPSLVAATNTDISITFCIPLVSILSLTNNYVPLFAMKGSPLRIEIQLVSSIQQIINSSYQTAAPATAATDFVAHSSRKIVDNVELSVNIMEISDSGMNIIQSAIGNAPLQWVVQDYRNFSFNTNLPNSVTSVSVPIPCKVNSLNSLFFTFRQNATGVSMFSALESCSFNLLEYFFRIGSKTLPYKPPNNVPEMFSEFLRALGSVSDVNHECNIRYSTYNQTVPSKTPAYGLSSFYVGIDLESYSNAPLDTTYSGLNTSTDDIFANFKFGANATTPNIRIDTFCLYDVLILIENGQCQVQY